MLKLFASVWFNLNVDSINIEQAIYNVTRQRVLSTTSFIIIHFAYQYCFALQIF